MKELWSNMRRLFGNKWVKFTLVSIIYVLWLVIWSRNWWMLIGVLVIFDIYITKYIQRMLFGKKHQERKANNKAYREAWSWVEAIVFAVIAATLIHTYVFQMYRIPTSSMEKTLLVGDYLFVSKVAYGPRMAMTPLSFPLVHNKMPLSQTKKSYCESVSRPYKRIAGFGDVKRGDIVVFNFPAGDTVLQEQPNVTYYDVLRDYQQQFGNDLGREMLNKQYTIISHPVDKREHYVKRAVALPGDTLTIKNRDLYINGIRQQDPVGRQYNYYVRVSGTPISRAKFEELGIAKDDILFDKSMHIYLLPLTDEQLTKIQSLKNVVAVENEVYDRPHHRIYPNDDRYAWTEDNFGPLWIPQRGATVQLTIDNLPLYSRIIKNYEGNDLLVRDDVIYINGSPTDSYTFAMDYYFMMGDNRHNSADSRFWGFVPKDHVVGKPAFVALSTDKDKSFPGNIRWGRLFSSQK